ncbi:MAG TPA: SpoIIE family protein phosphatase, partial [Tenuifilaceae bacterium]|nr:SpoIIE family protein phosphatase [Tenuifilaceae bacterium]
GQTVEFAGAKNPLFYVTNGQVNQVRGDPVPVGGLQKEKERQYTLHTIHIDTPTCFYIFSDGYIDQFGGPYNQKFSSQQFKELLLKVHQLPMIQQQEILETTMDEWQGSENKQIDDIMVIGFRLNAKPLGI